MNELGNKAFELLVQYLKVNYDFPHLLAERYANILIARFVERGINDHIDASVIAEDLYQETEDWETPDYMAENVQGIVKMNLDFPNLDYSEQKSKEYIEKESELLRSLK